MKRYIYLAIVLLTSLGLLAGVTAPAATASSARPAVATASAQVANPAPTPDQLQYWLDEAQIVLQIAQATKTLLLDWWNYIQPSERNNDLVWLNDEIAALQADIAEVQGELNAGVITMPSLPTLPPQTPVSGGGGCIAPPPFACITAN
jgi:hypothetical protein